MKINKFNDSYGSSFSDETRKEMETFFGIVNKHYELPDIDELYDGYEIVISGDEGFAYVIIGTFLMYKWTHPVLKDWYFMYDGNSIVFYGIDEE